MDPYIILAINVTSYPITKSHPTLFLTKLLQLFWSFLIVMDTIVLFLITITLIFFALFAKWAWKVWSLVWVRPRKVEKNLRKQGLKGNSYRFLYGDVKQNSEMNKKAMSLPMNLSDDVAARAIPLIHQTVNKYGNLCDHYTLLHLLHLSCSLSFSCPFSYFIYK